MGLPIIPGRDGLSKAAVNETLSTATPHSARRSSKAFRIATSLFLSLVFTFCMIGRSWDPDEVMPFVDTDSLQSLLTEQALIEKGENLLGFAYDSPNRNRYLNSPGHNATLKYIRKTLHSLDYYDVQMLPVVYKYFTGSSLFQIDGEPMIHASAMRGSPQGHVTGSLVLVEDYGCEAGNYPSNMKGGIALIERGNCTFGTKSQLAHAAGAGAALIWSSTPGWWFGYLGEPEEGQSFVITLSVLMKDGVRLSEKLREGEDLFAAVVSNARYVTLETTNIVATTRMGDQDHVYQLGAHSDSVGRGPGINDDGSGTISLLEVATHLSKFQIKNAVRFSWWAAEEEGLIGSTFYVHSLSAEERAKIRLYLNFDMMASPNFVYAVYDGSGLAFGNAGPPGSDIAEVNLRSYFATKNIVAVATAFDGRSDYAGFFDAGIPSGGIDTGAEQLKTPLEEYMFGGQAGIPYDINYHGPGDTVDNCNKTAWLTNTRGIADSVARYAMSFKGLPERNMSHDKIITSGLSVTEALDQSRERYLQRIMA
ncbi:Leucyl aminopeptidase yscIV [Agyrium rufum]|nr:Leucyl aminopeptidase yscIV [Agyrium rufum]